MRVMPARASRSAESSSPAVGQREVQEEVAVFADDVYEKVTTFLGVL
jgi:hypothetical protein